MKLTAFCMRCKATVTPDDHKIVVMENGRKRMSAICPNDGCDGKLSKIVGYSKPEHQNVSCVTGISHALEGSWSRGYDVALTWRRSQVQFLPSPPIGFILSLLVNQ